MRVLISPGSAVVGKRASLDESEAHHLRVRRAREDEGVEVLDGSGLTGTGRLVRIGSDWMVEIQSAQRQPVQPRMTLAVAAGDHERFAWMAEKAVELAVSVIVPLETARTAGVATRLRQAHGVKLRRLVLEATKQCGAAWAPTVEPPVALEEFLARPILGTGWLADPAGAPPPAALDDTPLTVVIGPEGGFTGEERGALVSVGYGPVALGAHTLRFETAALAAAAAIGTARLRGKHG
ncbi:MAG: RsmE family RNA methyltransferase [Gemmatimonadales bacterium]